jgi:hypothetical protein
MLPYVRLALAGLLLAMHPAFAAQKKPAPSPSHANGARALGHYDDWVAAVHPESGQPVCYAFTRATKSSGAGPGRGDVVLTVTQRGAGHDTVAISAGFAYAPNASVHVDVDSNGFEFYTAQRSAFARDGHAAVAAFERGRQVVAHSPGPKGTVIADSFSLRGFTAAYNAIRKACPPGKATT